MGDRFDDKINKKADSAEKSGKQVGPSPLSKELADLPEDVFQDVNRQQADRQMSPEFGNFSIDTQKSKPKDGTHAGADPGTFVTYKNGLEQKMHFKNGYEVTIARTNPKAPSEITGLEFKDETGKATSVTRVEGKPNTFTDGKYNWNVNYESKDGNLITHDFKNGVIMTQTISGQTINLDEKKGIEITYQNGAVQQIKDNSHNFLWKKQNDKSWKLTALDQSKPFKQPTDDSLFVTDDSTRYRIHPDGSFDKLSDMTYLRERITRDKVLTQEQKDRLLKDYLPKFQARQFLDKTIEETNKDRNESIYHLSTLLDKAGPGAYSDIERCKALEQTAAHFAEVVKYRQHGRTCNVTDIGVSFIEESPRHFIRTLAEVLNTGTFHTTDGSTLTPPRTEIEAALRDQPFPSDTVASGVSRAFAVVATNIHWQRREKDGSGNPVTKGSLVYEQSSGEGVYWYKNGQRHSTYDPKGSLLNHPHLALDELVDIGQQITGESWQNKTINCKENLEKYPIRPYTKAPELRKLVGSADSAETLGKLLSGKGAQIVGVHTGRPPFYYESGSGSEAGAGGPGGCWHVIVKTKCELAYDANNKIDPDKSLVYYKNTWDPRADHLTRETALTLSQLHCAQKEPVYVRYYNQQTGAYFWGLAQK